MDPDSYFEYGYGSSNPMNTDPIRIRIQYGSNTDLDPIRIRIHNLPTYQPTNLPTYKPTTTYLEISESRFLGVLNVCCEATMKEGGDSFLQGVQPADKHRLFESDVENSLPK